MIGYLVGMAVGSLSLDLWMGGQSTLQLDYTMDQLFDPNALILIILGAPLLAGVASWLPAMLAAQQDPAAILCEE